MSAPDKPKRQLTTLETTGISTLIDVPRLEFLSPLTLEECVRKLETKGRHGRRSPDKLEVYTRRLSPGAYRFELWRTVDEGNEWRHILMKQRRSVTHVHISGTLRYWDDESTLVTCQANLGWYVAGVIMFMLLVLAMAVMFLLQGDPGALNYLVIGGIVVLLAGGWAWVSIAQEHRRMLLLVDDMLRNPIRV